VRYFASSELTETALAALREYDAEVLAKLPANYRWNIRSRDWELLPILRSPLQPGTLALDTGSFNTFLGVWLAQFAGTVYVTDRYLHCLKSNIMRRLGLWKRRPLEAPFEQWRAAVRGAGSNIRLRPCDLTSIDFPDNTFDFISSISVVEHIVDYEKAVAEMHRVLKPKGRLLITTDCSPEPVAYHNGVRSFSPRELEELFSHYPITSESSSPDFSRCNWCYNQNRPVVTAFIELTKIA
jgi:SAM-dependent methyltransferase